MGAKIWGFMIFVGGLLLAVLKIFSMGKKAGTTEVTSEVNAKSVKQQQKATGAMVDGLENENKVRDEDADPSIDHFTKQ